MSNYVDFNEQNEFHIKSRRVLGAPETPGMVRLLLRSGIVRSEKQAVFVLLLVVVLFVSASFLALRAMVLPSQNYVVDEDGRRYTIEEQLRAVQSGDKSFDDFQ